MYFDHISPSSSSHGHLPFSSLAFCLLNNPLIPVCATIHSGCRAFQWSKFDSWGTTPLKKTDSLSLDVTSWPQCPSLSCSGMPTGLLWFRSCAVCHGCHEFLSIALVMSRRHCLILGCLDLRLLQSFCLSYVMVPGSLGVYNINVPPFILAELPTDTDSLHFD